MTKRKPVLSQKIKVRNRCKIMEGELKPVADKFVADCEKNPQDGRTLASWWRKINQRRKKKLSKIVNMFADIIEFQEDINKVDNYYEMNY
ncbi:MAG: hypothetical protein ACLUD2_21660 [Clostridium sp.]